MRFASWRQLITEITAVLALLLSGFALYLQFRTEHDLTATAVGLFAQRIGDPAIVRVRVTLAFMNNGTVPEVVTVGWILIGNCADMSDGLPMIPKEDVTPFVIGPNESLGD